MQRTVRAGLVGLTAAGLAFGGGQARAAKIDMAKRAETFLSPPSPADPRVRLDGHGRARLTIEPGKERFDVNVDDVAVNLADPDPCRAWYEVVLVRHTTETTTDENGEPQTTQRTERTALGQFLVACVPPNRDPLGETAGEFSLRSHTVPRGDRVEVYRVRPGHGGARDELALEGPYPNCC